MLTWLERIVTLTAVLIALEVGFFCVYGGGTDLTAAEEASLRKRITVMTSSGGRDALAEKLRHWDEYKPKGTLASSGGARGGAAKGAAKDESGGKDEEEEPEEAPTARRSEFIRSMEVSLPDDGSRWEYREIPAAYRDALVPDMRSGVRLLQEASAKLVDLGDGTSAYQITSIQPNSIIAEGGFQRGDKLISVNDRPVSGTQDAMRLYNELRNEDRFVVVIERDGQRMTLFYDLK